MPESDSSHLSEADLMPQKEEEVPQKLSRRKLLKRAGGIALGAATVTTLGRGAVGFGEDVGKLYLKEERSVQNDASSSSETVPTQEDPVIKDIEARLGIRLVNLREAYQIMGMPFDETNTVEFGDSLPMRWDQERARMVEAFYGHLPEFFHEPDGNGNPLMITLTNFGSRPASGDYFLDNHDFMRLDVDAFTPDNREGAFHLLTHESTHHLQDLGYSKLNQKLPQLFHKDIQRFCQDTIEWLDMAGDGLGTEDDVFFLGMLRYGVQDTLNTEDPSKSRTNTSEFEAVMSEFYVHGADFFNSHMGSVYGEKAEDLYRYMRDEIFGGKEYFQFPLEPKEQNDSKETGRQEEDLKEASKMFNSAVQALVLPKGREVLSIPLLSEDEGELQELRSRGLLKAQTEAMDGAAGKGKVVSIDYKTSLTDKQLVSISKFLTLEGEVISENVTIHSPHAHLPIEQLAETAFPFPKDEKVITDQVDEDYYMQFPDGDYIYLLHTNYSTEVIEFARFYAQ